MSKPSIGSSLETKGVSPAGPSLIEAWRQHMHNPNFVVQPYHLHRLGLCVYLYCLLAVPTIFLTQVLPYLQLHEHLWWAAIFLTSFLTAENFLNYRACLSGHHNYNVVHCFHCQKTNSSVLAWQQEVDGTGRHCVTCQMEVPARSHHCRLCNLCVMRRHFHCYLLCCCIGQGTHGYFLIFCLYSAVSMASGALTFGAYVVGVGGWPSLFLPVALLHWATGAASAALPVVAFSLYAQLACLVVATVYGHLQLQLILRNQTLNEVGSMNTSYQLDIYENLRAAVGSWKRWPLLLVYPVRVEPGSDGCHWKMRCKKN